MASPADVIPVVLCGGSGTRLWPLSRTSYPKQYWPLVDGHTLLQNTLLRLGGLPGVQAPVVVCSEHHRFLAAEQLRQIQVAPAALLLEPVGRNTALAVAVATLHAMDRGGDPLLLVLAADHNITDTVAFRRAVGKGMVAARAGRLVTFGIVPTKPETGYGYIEAEATADSTGALPIRRFVEKPDGATAEQFLASGNFTWNSGLFLFRASRMLAELTRFNPELVQAARDALDQGEADLDFLRLARDPFERCPSVAIDVAVMEKTSLGSVVPLEAGWSDVGSWDALWDLGSRDGNGNVLRGRVLAEDARNCYVRSEHRLVVGLGIEDLVVVETSDAVLVARRDRGQQVKHVVLRLKADGANEATSHRRIYRPWGYYDAIVEGRRWQVKTIRVNPGASLSLQMHHHRSEHWVVVQGTAEVERDGAVALFSENQSVYIPLGCRHRLSNPGRIELQLIEVQSGTYLGEDDIVRFADAYGRVSAEAAPQTSD